jgi:hypothetical protein
MSDSAEAFEASLREMDGRSGMRHDDAVALIKECAAQAGLTEGEFKPAVWNLLFRVVDAAHKAGAEGMRSIMLERASASTPAGEPKPIVWLLVDLDGAPLLDDGDPVARLGPVCTSEKVDCIPVYRTPPAPPAPKVVPLSDEQIEAIALEHEHMGFGRVGSNELSMHAFGPDALRAFVRDIEAALSAAPSDPKA